MMPPESRTYSEIYRLAVGLLARREHSRSELERKLSKRGFAKAEIDTLLSRLQTDGLQSESRFTEEYVHSRSQKGYGPVRIKDELQQRGIDESLLEEFLDFQSQKWEQIAIDAQVKRFGAVPPENYRDYAKRVRFLQYRGFTAQQIKADVGTFDQSDY